MCASVRVWDRRCCPMRGASRGDRRRNSSSQAPESVLLLLHAFRKSPLPAPPPSPSPICAPHPVRSLPLGAHPALRPRPPPLSWLAWVASPHHHAPGGREVDGALSRPSPKRNGAPNTCPDYCAFPGCSLSVREGSVRVVTPWNTRTPAPSPSRGSTTLTITGRRPGLHRLGRETPDWHPCLSGQGGPPQGPQELRLAAFLPL